uniref:Uncharacterized protein n=1 Tax=Anguilla anguilla TaxID=7936 RepID=A0A0E9RHY7_ANGAN
MPLTQNGFGRGNGFNSAVLKNKKNEKFSGRRSGSVNYRQATSHLMPYP